jgi:spore photoproduct lyase
VTALPIAPVRTDAPPKRQPDRGPKIWIPKRVVVTPAALEVPHGRAIVERAAALGAEVHQLKSNRLTGLSEADKRHEYVRAKSTLAVVTASPAKMRLQPIPPSADWRFDLAEGCPAHCQYCYLAGSLSGPPVTRAYANVEEIFAGLSDYVGRGTITSKSAARAHEGTTFEASCYTDPLGIEHLTGSLAQAIRFFGRWNADAQLRWTTKYDGVDHLLGLPHGRRTRVRFSVNAEPITRKLEGGTAALPARLSAMGRMARAGYPVGLTVAPIMPIEDWRSEYASLLDHTAAALEGVHDLDLTVELITHRFTPGSKEVLTDWYPGSALEMDESVRAKKTTKFGSLKYVYPAETMRELRAWFEREIPDRMPAARVLYWT